jgi:hypothetical protein
VESAIPVLAFRLSARPPAKKVRRDSQGSPPKIEFSAYLHDKAREL